MHCYQWSCLLSRADLYCFIYNFKELLCCTETLIQSRRCICDWLPLLKNSSVLNCTISIWIDECRMYVEESAGFKCAFWMQVHYGFFFTGVSWGAGRSIMCCFPSFFSSYLSHLLPCLSLLHHHWWAGRLWFGACSVADWERGPQTGADFKNRGQKR